MKIKIDIECTPQEARAFFGLPDVAPLQEAVMEGIKTRLMETLGTMDPETLFKTWLPAGLPAGLPGWEQAQKAFWAQMTGAGKK